MTVTVASSCTACGLCLVTCPEHALRPAPGRPAVVDDRCTDCWLCLEVCPVDAISPRETPSPRETSGPSRETPSPSPDGPRSGDSEPAPARGAGNQNASIHPIEVESYRILEDRVDLSGWAEGDRAVVARVIHSTADLEFADTMRIGAEAVDRARAALAAGAPVICDAHMLRVGITRLDALCLLDEVPVAPAGSTRSAAAVELAASRYPEGALWVVGNAPTALFEILRLVDEGRLDPAAVIGLPVGFVGAKESKAALWAGGLQARAVTNVGEKGGTSAAAGAVNALVRSL